MTGKKISQMGAVSLPLNGSEYLEAIQSGMSRKFSVAQLITAVAEEVSAVSVWGGITGTLTDQLDLVSYVTTAAGNAQAAAISTAATDATTKANAAQAAAQTYADTLVVGLLDDRGNYDASSNIFPNSGGSGPAGVVKKGDLWTISVAGILGTVPVTTGDVVRALADAPGQTANNWTITENNIGFVPENSANKVTGLSGASTDVQYPSAKLVYDQLALKTNAAIVPNTTPSAGQMLVGNAGGTAYAAVGMSGDATLASTGALTLATTQTAAHTWAGVQTFTQAPVFTDAPGSRTALGVPAGSGTSTGNNSGDQTSVSGNAGTATALATARNIDGVAFNGTADITVIAPATHAATSKATPVDADEIPLVNSASGNTLFKGTWANIKATLKTYFDTVYAVLAGPTFTGTTTISEAFKLTGILSPAQITSNQNDYAPTGFATATMLRLDEDAPRAITGLAGGASGRIINICNNGSFDLLLANESASSTAANRFAIRRGLIIPPNRSVTLWYDATTARWRLLGEPPRVCMTILPADVVNSNASADTLADVTGLKFAVIAGFRYQFYLYCVYDAAATTTGSRWTINGPALTALDYTSRIPATTSTVTQFANAFADVYQKPSTSTGGSNSAGNIALVEGQITCSADGYVQAQFASEISSSAITALGGQCFFEYECISS